MKRLLNYLIIICFPVAIYSQGEFISKGQNAFGISGSFNVAVHRYENVPSLSLGIGASSQGILDLSIDYSRDFLEHSGVGAFDIGCSLWAIKSNNFPLQAGINGGLLFADYFNTLKNGYFCGIGIVGKSNSDSKVLLVPEINFTLSAIDEMTAGTLTMGLALLLKMNTIKLIIMPGCSIGKDYPVVSINTGIIFLKPSKSPT